MHNGQSPKIYLLPNLMTAGNLFCGFAAVLRIMMARRRPTFLKALPDFHDAIWFILAACISICSMAGSPDSVVTTAISEENSIR